MDDIGTYPTFNGILPPEPRRDLDWYNHPDFVDWEQDLLVLAPDAWDDDVSSTEIVTRFVNHLVEEVKRTGGCLYPWCLHKDFEPCDHGYLEAQAEPPVTPEVIEDLKRMELETRVELVGCEGESY